jgi:hypothetical protein
MSIFDALPKLRDPAQRTLKVKARFALDLVINLISMFIMVAGVRLSPLSLSPPNTVSDLFSLFLQTYGAVVSIIDEFNSGNNGVFTCKDNSNSS